MARTTNRALSIDLLRLDGDTQSRVKINEDTVDDYVEVLEKEGGEWPFEDIDVFHDGSDYFVADGFHRTLAGLRVKRASVPCRIHQGTAKDARIFGMTANDTHGLRMTREDKHACVEWLLDNFRNLTQAEVATKAGVSERHVRRIVADRKPKSENRPMSYSEAKPSKKPGKTSSNKKSAEVSPEPAGKTDSTDKDVERMAASSSLILDSLGTEIPPEYHPANEVGIRLMSIGRELDRFRQLAKELNEQPGGEWLRMQNIDDYVRSLKAQFQDARLYAICPACKGKASQCKKCNGYGWLPEYLKGTI